MRIIPATMATQHPDNAMPPFWDETDAYVAAHREAREAVACFQDLGSLEYMWDWEGKNADAAVIDRLFTNYLEYFSKHQLGRDKFLTFRIPNIWEEKGYNLLQAMTVILSSEDFARDLQIGSRPLFEVILPMTERAKQVIHMQKLFEKLAKFKAKDFTPDRMPNETYLELIPLVESVESQLGVTSLLAEYLRLHEAHFGFTPKYLRVFLACSDSALSSGFVAGILGNKLALARLNEFSQEQGIPIYPILGSGSLRFRGGLAPDTVDRFLQEFPGVRTVSVQSSFRYDHPLAAVKRAIAKLESALPQAKPLQIDPPRQAQLVSLCGASAKIYKKTLRNLLADMQPYFEAVPKRRERRQHIGLLAYGRSLGAQTMPRAITFTAGFYSVGVPPEFIGAGRALRSLSPAELDALKQAYPNLAADFVAAGRYLNRENLRSLAERNDAWAAVEEDISALEGILGVNFQPKTDEQVRHQKLSSELLASAKADARKELINDMAILRRSLG